MLLKGSINSVSTIDLSFRANTLLSYYYYYYYYYLTAVGLTSGGSSTVHIYTQTEHPVAVVHYTFIHKQNIRWQ
jgi:hypothetical protein